MATVYPTERDEWNWREEALAKKIAELERQVTSLTAERDAKDQEIARLKRLAKEATNGWACYAKSKLERNEIGRLHTEIDRALPHAAPREETPS